MFDTIFNGVSVLRLQRRRVTMVMDLVPILCLFDFIIFLCTGYEHAMIVKESRCVILEIVRWHRWVFGCIQRAGVAGRAWTRDFIGEGILSRGRIG